MKLDRVIAVRNRKTVFRDGNKCIKVFGSDYSKADVLSEALGQSRVEEIGLSVPAVLEVTVLDGKWAIISEYIRGMTLSELSREHPECGRRYMEKLIEVQLEILSKRLPMLPRLGDKLRRKLECVEISDDLRHALLTRLSRLPDGLLVCHGDLTPSNVIVTNRGEYFVIDWAHVTQGCAAADAARTYVNFTIDDSPAKAREYLELFCAESGVDAEEILLWQPIVAAAQSVKASHDRRRLLLEVARDSLSERPEP